MSEAGENMRIASSKADVGRTRLSVCMIVRDNEHTLPAALQSIKPYVDEMIVVDTGSVDDTPEIAKSMGAKVFHFPWCDDFAKARNVSLEHASGDWLFWMDSDDTIPPGCGEKLRSLADQPLDTSPMAYVMQVHCPGPDEEATADVTVVDHVKMFRNQHELRFEGRIHEQVLAAIRKLDGKIGFTDIYVVHSGSDHSAVGRKRKMERDLRLIRLELEEQPEHPFHLFNLGMTLAYENFHEEAVVALRHMLEVAQPYESPVRKAYALLTKSLTELKQYEEALSVVETGLGLFSQDSELHFRLGLVLHQLSRREEAIGAYRAALIPEEGRYFASVDRGIAGFKARHNLAVIYTQLGQLDQAELQWRLALEEVPSYRGGWRGLVECLLAQRKLITCEVELEQLERLVQSAPAHASLLMDWYLFRFELAKARGDKKQAAEFLEQIPAEMVQQPDVLRVAGQFHFETNDLSAAEESLAALTQQIPSDGAAWHNLGTVYMLQQRFDKAVDALDVSLRVRPEAEPTKNQFEEAKRCRAQQETVAPA